MKARKSKRIRKPLSRKQKLHQSYYAQLGRLRGIRANLKLLLEKSEFHLLDHYNILAEIDEVEKSLRHNYKIKKGKM